MRTKFVDLLAMTIPEYAAGYNAGRAGELVNCPYSSFEYFKCRDWLAGYADGEADRADFLSQQEG